MVKVMIRLAGGIAGVFVNSIFYQMKWSGWLRKRGDWGVF